MVHLDNTHTVDSQPPPTRLTVEDVPRSDVRVSLLLLRDLEWLALFVFLILLSFFVLAAGRPQRDNQGVDL